MSGRFEAAGNEPHGAREMSPAYRASAAGPYARRPGCPHPELPLRKRFVKCPALIEP